MKYLLPHLFPVAVRRSFMRAALVALALACVWIGVNAGNLWELSLAARDHHNKEQQLRVARKRVEDLEKRRERLLSSDFESEKRLRELMLLRPGERVIVIEDAEKE